MPRYVLDASVLIALVQQEKGSDKVTQAIKDGATISAVNLSEIVAKLNELGAPETTIQSALYALSLTVIPFDTEMAYQAGLLRSVTKHLGLSFGDRACLTLAKQLQLPVLTTDKIWERLTLGITIHVIR